MGSMYQNPVYPAHWYEMGSVDYLKKLPEELFTQKDMLRRLQAIKSRLMLNLSLLMIPLATLYVVFNIQQ